MPTDRQLQDLFNQLNRFFPITAEGGKVGDRVWIKIDGKRVQATYHHNIQAGECLAILADDGQYYLVNTQKVEPVQKNTRVIQARRTKPTTEKIVPANFKVLFSVVDGGERRFYVGGDRPTPILVATVPNSATIQGAYITNKGKPSQYDISIKYQLAEENYCRYVNNINGTQYDFADNVLLNDSNTFLAFRGAATWISPEIIPGTGFTDPVITEPSGEDGDLSARIETQNLFIAPPWDALFEGSGISVFTAYCQFVTTESGNLFCEPYRETNENDFNIQTKNFYINKTSSAYNNGLYTINNFQDFNPTSTLVTGTFVEDTTNNTFLPSGASSFSYVSDYDQVTNDQVYTITGNFLITRGVSFIREEMGFSYRNNDGDITYTRGSTYYLNNRVTNSDKFICLTQGFSLDESTTAIATPPTTILIDPDSFLLVHGITLTQFFDSLVGEDVILGKIKDAMSSYLAKGSITSYTFSSGDLSLAIAVDSVIVAPFVSFATTEGKVLLDSGSVFEYLLCGASSFQAILPSSLNSFAGVNLFPELIDSSQYVRDRLVTDNLVKNKIFISQINEAMKTANIAGYAEEWKIDSDGNFIRQDALREGLIYSLGNAGATIHSISYWASK
ncbi:hypothetical protein ACX27_04165 [Nostoc piscinale CENA21]|uniref:Uncharacterized protein n=1 Tax=Nostoc piscinale CENA21 TaxID=224013 RepID=A0A0M4SP45_9NOSO|nr:hypothetical protein [Nostoc piscinale]ALF52228.1 hypothetical protein ACX27_04165 [Nostoc piscinale CENA21]